MDDQATRAVLVPTSRKSPASSYFTAGPFVQYNITQSTTPTLPNDPSVLPAMHSFLRLLFASLLLLPLLALAAPPPAASLRLHTDYTDPHHISVPSTSTSLLFSGFSAPFVHFESSKLLDLAADAQYEIVQAVAANRGDGPVPAPNMMWCSRGVCLFVNHVVGDGLTWLILSAAISGVIEFGWYANWSYCKHISILDEAGGVRVVGTGELIRDPRYGAARNATETA